MEGNSSFDVNLLKRKRKCNFSPSETRLISDMVEKHADILMSKSVDNTTNYRKHQLWSEITDAVNRIGFEHRTSQEVRGRWKNLHGLYMRRLRANLAIKREIEDGESGDTLDDNQTTDMLTQEMFRDLKNNFNHEKDALINPSLEARLAAGLEDGTSSTQFPDPVPVSSPGDSMSFMNTAVTMSGTSSTQHSDSARATSPGDSSYMNTPSPNVNPVITSITTVDDHLKAKRVKIDIEKMELEKQKLEMELDFLAAKYELERNHLFLRNRKLELEVKKLEREYSQMSSTQTINNLGNSTS